MFLSRVQRHLSVRQLRLYRTPFTTIYDTVLSSKTSTSRHPLCPVPSTRRQTLREHRGAPVIGFGRTRVPCPVPSTHHQALREHRGVPVASFGSTGAPTRSSVPERRMHPDFPDDIKSSHPNPTSQTLKTDGRNRITFRKG